MNEPHDDTQVGRDSGRISQSQLRVLRRAVALAMKCDCEEEIKMVRNMKCKEVLLKIDELTDEGESKVDFKIF